GRSARENDLVRRACTEEACDFVAGALISIGRTGRELVSGAVDVGVLVLVEINEPVDDGLRLLCRRGVVEPDQRPAVDRLAQDREVAPDRVDIEGGMRRGVAGGVTCRRFRCRAGYGRRPRKALDEV